jgi:hypothetical protein
MLVESVSDTPAGNPEAQSVEISGWDAEGQFFVETTRLDSIDSGEVAVLLLHRVNSGSLVFVRLLHAEGAEIYGKSYPTASEAHVAGSPDLTGRCRVRLIPCQPHSSRRRGDRGRETRI